jgi:hypothetical protein
MFFSNGGSREFGSAQISFDQDGSAQVSAVEHYSCTFLEKHDPETSSGTETVQEMLAALSQRRKVLGSTPKMLFDLVPPKTELYSHRSLSPCTFFCRV